MSAESESSLLTTLDKLADKEGMTFNGAVTRKALKMFAFDDVQTCSFTRLMTTTYEIFTARFVVEEENADETPDQFFILTCAQILTRMIRKIANQISQKKDRALRALVFGQFGLVLIIC